MIEANAFLAMFVVQIVALSVLYPAWWTKYARVKMEGYYADERFAQLYPGKGRAAIERYFVRYRALNLAIAVLGLFFLGWFFSYTRRPDWSDGPVEALVAVYFVVQMLPLLFVTGIYVWANRKARKRFAPETKRTASLQRRGLFDFVSPFTVFLAVAGYFLYAAFALYLDRHPFPAYAGALINIGAVTLIYAVNVFSVYWQLYGKKSHPLETRADRVHVMSWTVKVSVYSCIVFVASISLNFTLVLLDQERWEPFGQSAFLVITMFLCSMGLFAPPRRDEGDGLDSCRHSQVPS